MVRPATTRLDFNLNRRQLARNAARKKYSPAWTNLSEFGMNLVQPRFGKFPPGKCVSINAVAKYKRNSRTAARRVTKSLVFGRERGEKTNGEFFAAIAHQTIARCLQPLRQLSLVQPARLHDGNSENLTIIPPNPTGSGARCEAFLSEYPGSLCRPFRPFLNDRPF